MSDFIINKNRKWYINLKCMKYSPELWLDIQALLKANKLASNKDEIKIVQRPYNYKNEEYDDISIVLDELYDKYEKNAKEEFVIEGKELKLRKIKKGKKTILNLSLRKKRS